VTWGVVRDEQHLAQPHGIAVAEDAIDLDRGLTHDLPVVAVVEVALAAVFDHGDVWLHDRNLCAGQLLEVGERPGVIRGPFSLRTA
jgi:hypothetical protein